jgi:ABC-type multidrug transport system ATPase subunit
VIATTGLTKTIDKATALAGIDLSIARGECVAIAGPEDGGRALLLRILATLTPPSSGHIVIGGLDAVSDTYRVRRLVAYAGVACVPSNRLRVVEYLRVVTAARRQPSAAAAAAAELVGVNGDAPIESLSDEGRLRLPLAAALASAADVLLLDDPFRALDEPRRVAVSDWLVNARERGTTVVVGASDEAIPALCERIVRVHAGRIVAPSAANAGAPFGLSRELVGA